MKLTILPKGFEPVELPLEEESFDVNKVKMESFILHIDATMAYRVYDEFEQSDIKKQEDGSFIVSVQYPYDSWVLSFILSFGSSCYVISPTYVKEEIMK